MKTPTTFDELTLEYVLFVQGESSRLGCIIQQVEWGSGDWKEKSAPFWAWCANCYRVAPEPPKKRLRPWRNEEVPMPLVIKAKSLPTVRFMVLTVRPGGAIFGSSFEYQFQASFEALLDEYQCDDGSPCGVEEEE